MCKNKKGAIVALVKSSCKRNGTINVRAQGISMAPTLIEGDILQIEPAKEYLSGEIVVFFNQMAKNLLAHRILTVYNGKYITKGDNAIINEEVEPEDILGRVKNVQRGKEIFGVSDLLLCSGDDVAKRSQKVMEEYYSLKSIELVFRTISYNQFRMYLYKNIRLSGNNVSISTQYYERFSCKGEKCTNNCCKRGYIIYIDKAGYERYIEVCNEYERLNFLSNICLLPDGEATDRKHAIIDCRDGICPYLSEERLCTICKKYGDIIISEICREYPRIVKKHDGYELKALQMTCEAAAELMLLHIAPTAIIARAADSKHVQSVNGFNNLKRLLAYACVVQFRVLPIYKRLSALAWLEKDYAYDEHPINFLCFDADDILRASKAWLKDGNKEIMYAFEIEDLYSFIFSTLLKKISEENVTSVVTDIYSAK